MENKDKIKLSVTPYKGTRDFYPEDMEFRNWMFNELRKVLTNNIYSEYNGPMVEPLELYAAKSGKELVSEQTYNFIDRGGRHITLRPEMTPTVSRMIAKKVNSLIFPVRWFSIANFYRYERPQKGRLREHYQLNVDLFGSNSIESDIEILNVIIQLLTNFGADKEMFEIRINNRKFFNAVIKTIVNFEDDEKYIDLTKLIDRKDKIGLENFIATLKDLEVSETEIKDLLNLFDFNLEDAIKICKETEGAKELEKLFSIINSTELNDYCKFDFSIIRGLDYYTGTVFEVYDNSPENKIALFGGGRYDNLVGLFTNNKKVPGIGFGCGDVTLELFLQNHNLVPNCLEESKKAIILRFDDVDLSKYYKVAAKMRKYIPTTIYFECCKISKQIEYALKSNFDYVIIMGKDELEKGIIKCKNLSLRTEETLNFETLELFFKEI